MAADTVGFPRPLAAESAYHDGHLPELPLSRFHKLLAASISQAVSSAALHEQERQRAEALAEDALAAADVLSVEERERWTLVHRNTLRLSKLVNTLLDFSRIEAGRVEASFEPTDLTAFTNDLASMFRSAIDRGGLRLRLDLPQIEEPAYIDHDMWA